MIKSNYLFLIDSNSLFIFTWNENRNNDILSKYETKDKDGRIFSPVKKTKDLMKQKKKIEEILVLHPNNKLIILIDEAQFFTDLKIFCEYFIIKNAQIFVYGLNGTYKQKAWNSIIDLIPIASNIKILKGICQVNGCIRDSIVSRKHIEFLDENDDQEPDLGDSGNNKTNKYISLCFECHKSFNK